MVRSETFPFQDYALATPGQLTWVWINQLLDHDERLRKIHVHCLPKFYSDRCEVCGDTVLAIDQLPDEIQEEVYRPAPNEIYEVEVDMKKPDTFEGRVEITEP